MKRKFLRRLKKIDPNNIAACIMLVMVLSVVIGVCYYAVQDFEKWLDSHVIIISK